jgi:hypothetical protein
MRSFEVHLRGPFCFVFVDWWSTPFWKLWTLHGGFTRRSSDLSYWGENLLGIHGEGPVALAEENECREERQGVEGAMGKKNSSQSGIDGWRMINVWNALVFLRGSESARHLAFQG